MLLYRTSNRLGGSLQKLYVSMAASNDIYMSPNVTFSSVSWKDSSSQLCSAVGLDWRTVVLPLRVSWHEIFLFQNMLPIIAFIKVAFLFFRCVSHLLQCKITSDSNDFSSTVDTGH